MSEWISVKDRLPDDDERYLTFDGYDVDILMFDFFHKKVFMTFDYNGYPEYRNYITHWMPLPAPPEV